MARWLKFGGEFVKEGSMFGLISQLSHVELLTPKIDKSLRFFTEILGLTETARKGRSVYLRAWRNFFHHDLVLTEGDQPRLGHIGWRAAGADALKTAVQRLEASGLGEGWHEGEPGRGPGYRYRGPGGHLNEIYWQAERWRPPAELAPTFPNRPQRYVPRGIDVYHLDRVTIATANIMGDVAWYRDTLGFRFMEWTVLDEKSDVAVFATMTTNEQSHDLGLLGDHSDVPGRLHHIAFWLDQRPDVERAADILMEAGTPIEYGPGRHGIGALTYLYFREPGGLRVELNSGGYRNYQPDWEPVKWSPAQGANDFYRVHAISNSFLEAFPPHVTGAVPSGNVANPWAAASVR